MPKAEGTLYPLSQVPPDKYFLPKYAWFDYIRPLDKDDIFNWRPKKGGAELKPEKRREAPLQHLKAAEQDSTATTLQTNVLTPSTPLTP